MFASQKYHVVPDIMTCAKALGCGVPVGAFVLNKKTAGASLRAGDHGTTYGGNTLVCAAVSKVFDIFEEEHVVEHAKEMGIYLEQKLDEIIDKYDFITKRRGEGLMQELVITEHTPGEVVAKALEWGLIILSAGSDVVRLLPPLIIEKQHVDEFIGKLSSVFDALA